MKIIEFKEWKCKLAYDKYRNNDRIALSLFDVEDGSPVAIATVNLPEEPLMKNEVFIKVHSENDGMHQALFKAGIVSDIKEIVPMGFVHAVKCDLLWEE